MRLFVVFLLLCVVGLPGCSSDPTVRVATFNTALSRNEAGALHAALANGNDEQAKLVAEVLQRTRPDIVLLQEVDYDPTGKAYEDFQRNYLSVAQNGAEPIAYEYVYAPPVNTGVLADVDLDGDGMITRPNDCHGYGLFEGQYGMVVLSRYPIHYGGIKTYERMLWSQLPFDRMPHYYSREARRHMRLSSKTHADVPVWIDGEPLRLWVSHPTPPVFDGPEDRNGLRNQDEIWFWAYYKYLIEPKHEINQTIEGKSFSNHPTFYDSFVILGDLNADPNDGESRPRAIRRLIEHPKIHKGMAPTSQGALEAARLQAGKNLTHKSDPAADTADFGDGERGPGNLRVDYVLPGIELNVIGSGVYWPTTDNPHAYLNQASDHKLVWIDIRLP